MLEKEVDTLKAYITYLKARLAVYVPVKTDAIDVALAQYMNNYPDKRKIKIQFIRQGQGVYLFGTQLVNVKSERGSVQVKIGGGYQPIGEFLDQNTGKELEKYECKDPLKRLGDNLGLDHPTLEQTRSMSKSMKRLDSKATIRTSATKTPGKTRK